LSESSGTKDAVIPRRLWWGGVRGFLCIAATVVLPVLLAGAYFGMRSSDTKVSEDSAIDKLAFIVGWWWGIFVYPHPYFVESRVGGFDVVLKHPELIAIAQWIIVAVVFGVVSRNWRLRWQFPAAVATVLAVGFAISFGVELLGWEIQADGL